MKKNKMRYCLSGLIVLLSAVYAFAAEPADVILPLLEKGNAAQLCTYLAADAELVILGTNVRQSAQCSELRDFFAANKANSFAIRHKGVKQDACFIVGILETDGQNYRINMFVRNIPGGISIQQLRIEKE